LGRQWVYDIIDRNDYSKLIWKDSTSRDRKFVSQGSASGLGVKPEKVGASGCGWQSEGCWNSDFNPAPSWNDRGGVYRKFVDPILLDNIGSDNDASEY
jgi:hypothetical protein